MAFRQLVPFVGVNQEYRQSLTGLQVGLPYRIQIQALDRNSYVLYTSEDVNAQSSCTSPTHPPSNVALSAPDARHVRLVWTAPPQNAWGCNVIQYEIHVDEPRGTRPVTIDGRHSSHVFDSQPDQQWAVRIRTVNAAGQSAWSPSVSTRAAPAGEVIEGPFVTQVQGSPRLSWRIREGADADFVSYFQVEWRTPTDPRWNTHRNQVSACCT